MNDDTQAPDIIVEHPKFGELVFPAGTKPETITSAIKRLETVPDNKTEVKKQAVATIAPPTTGMDVANKTSLKDAWTNAESPVDRLKVMGQWMVDNKDKVAELAIKGGLTAAGQRVGGPAGGAITAPVAEYLGNLYAGKDTSGGDLVRAAIIGGTNPRAGQALANAARFVGSGLAGETAKTAIDEKRMISPQEAGNVIKNAGAASLTVATLDRGGRAAAETARMADDAALIETLVNANRSGLKIDPTIYNTGPVKGGIAKVAGQTNLQKSLSAANAPVVDDLVKQEIGLTQANGFVNDTSFSRPNFVRLKYQADTPFREARTIGAAPEVDAWLESVHAANDAARTARVTLNQTARTEARSEARRLYQDADRAFTALENRVRTLGSAGLADDLTNARVRLAQIYAVEKAANTASGRNVDALALGEMWSNGARLTGNLQTIGRLADAMPQVLGDPTKATALGTIARGGSLASATAAGFVGGGPAGAVAAAGMASMAPAAARTTLMNDTIQRLNLLPRYDTTGVNLPANILQFSQRL